MPQDYKVQEILSEVEDILDERSEAMFNRKYFGEIPSLISFLAPETVGDGYIDNVSGEDVFLIAIELNYKWSRAYYKNDTIEPLGNVLENIPEDEVVKNESGGVTEVVAPEQLQLQALQKLNISTFSMLEHVPIIRRMMVNQFCLEAINEDNFGEHRAAALTLYAALRLYKDPYPAEPLISETTYRPSTSELWNQLKTWQKILAVITILILTALTISAAITGVGLIAEALGAVVFSVVIGWSGLSSTVLGIVGGLLVAGALATSMVTKTITSNPHLLFMSSCLPTPVKIVRTSDPLSTSTSSNHSFSSATFRNPPPTKRTRDIPNEDMLKPLAPQAVSLYANPNYLEPSAYESRRGTLNRTYQQL